MAILIAPTKSNLIKAKSSLLLSQKGYEILDKKRLVLVKEMMALVNKVREMHDDIYDTLKDAYEALQKANVLLGVKNVEDISSGVPKEEEFDMLLRSVMGIDIPSLKFKKEDTLHPTYSIYGSNATLDEARLKFIFAKNKMYELAEVENSIYKLAREIQKIKKRTNALQYVQIPKYKELVKYIQNVLEEKEREDFFRLKRLKNK